MPSDVRRSSSRQPVLLDANAFFLPLTGPFDLRTALDRIEPPVEAWVPESVLTELDALVLRGVTGAGVARALARGYPRWPTTGNRDTAILTTARTGAVWVLTTDRGLIARLRSAGVTVLAPRSGGALRILRPLVRARATVIKRPPLVRRPRRLQRAPR